MHFDVHVASEVSEIGQHIGDKLCVVPGLILLLTKSSSQPEQTTSTLPVPLRLLSFQTLHL